jgi:ribosomal protein L35
MPKKGKSLKAIRKRLKITRKGKVLRRVWQQGHFKAKESGRVRQKKRRLVLTQDNPFIKKVLEKYIP